MPDNSLKLTIANLGLGRIGVAPITALEEASTEARTANAAIDHVLRATLREHPWAFATKYADPMTLLAGEAGDPVNRDWTFAYEHPSDCLFVRRILVPGGRAFDPTPVPYRKGREGDTLVIYTNEADAGIEYTALFECPVELADELFIDACAWRLAAEAAGPLTRNKLTTAEAMRAYQTTLLRAAVVSEREQQQEPAGEAEWIRER